MISLKMPGAGGYGDPCEREFDLINQDLKDGKITAERSIGDYQVVLDETGIAVDQEATKIKRAGA